MNAIAETSPLRADRFRQWWDAGFTDLVPIIPPGAPLTAKTRVDPASRGKCPGQRTPAGQWRGFSGWEDHETSAPDLDLWGHWGAGVGLRGAQFPGIDIDVTDSALAGIIEKIAENVLGPAPTRIGLAPKSLRPYRLGEGQDPMPGRTLTATGPDGARHLVEMRGDRQQYVVEGIHASTSRPYTWDICPARPGGGAALTPITAEMVDTFFADARTALETLGYEVREGRASAGTADDRLPIGDPAHLAPSIEAAVEALNAIPCADITDRAEWLRLCCAFKAAVGGDEAAYAPLVEWCGADPHNRPGYVRYHCWDSVSDAKGGWDALCREAERHGYNGAAHDFEPIDPLMDLIDDVTKGGSAGEKGEEPAAISATPFVWRDPAHLPRREWLYGHHLIRRFVSLTVAPGGAGKTSLLIADALAMVTGRNLMDVPVYGGRLRVWLWNLEDPRDELERRVHATLQHYAIAPDDIGDRLFLDSGRDRGLCIATAERNGVKVLEPVVDALVVEIKARRIDVLIVDPFVSSHQAPENDNGAIDRVAKTWGLVAERANCAVELVHHLRKLGDAEATAEHARGAVALVAAARSVRVLNKMTKDEADRAGLSTPRDHFRVADDKNNLARTADDAAWFRRADVCLPNGDHAPAVEPWKWPDAAEGVTTDDIRRVQEAIDGKGYRENVQAPEWVGHAVAKVLGLDVEDEAHKKRIKALLKRWVADGYLVPAQARGKDRKVRPIMEVGTWAGE